MGERRPTTAWQRISRRIRSRRNCVIIFPFLGNKIYLDGKRVINKIHLQTNNTRNKFYIFWKCLNDFYINKKLIVTRDSNINFIQNLLFSINFPDQKLTRGAIRRTDSLEDSKDGKNRYDEEFDGKSNKQERMVVEKLG